MIISWWLRFLFKSSDFKYTAVFPQLYFKTPTLSPWWSRVLPMTSKSLHQPQVADSVNKDLKLQFFIKSTLRTNWLSIHMLNLYE